MGGKTEKRENMGGGGEGGDGGGKDIVETLTSATWEALEVC